MPIVIPRSGEIPKPSPLPQEQIDRLWSAVINNWIDRHPDEFRAMLAAPAEQAKA